MNDYYGIKNLKLSTIYNLKLIKYFFTNKYDFRRD